MSAKPRRAKTDLTPLTGDARVTAVRRYGENKRAAARNSSGMQDPFVSIDNLRSRFTFSDTQDPTEIATRLTTLRDLAIPAGFHT